MGVVKLTTPKYMRKSEVILYVDTIRFNSDSRNS